MTTIFPDVDTYEKVKKALTHFDAWMNEAQQLIKDLKLIIEYQFTCNMCSDLAFDGKQVSSCLHFFCKKCLNHREKCGKGDLCFQCDKLMEGFNKNPIALDMLDRYRDHQAELEKLLKTHSTIAKMWDQGKAYPGSLNDKMLMESQQLASDTKKS